MQFSHLTGDSYCDETGIMKQKFTVHKSTADENFNDNYFIIGRGSQFYWAAYLSDGNCSA